MNKLISHKNFVILAPHVDDEMIGCFQHLSVTHSVYYFFEWDTDIGDKRTRADEARAVASRFGFTPHFVAANHTANLANLAHFLYGRVVSSSLKSKIWLVPSYKDDHPHHRLLSRAFTLAVSRALCSYSSADSIVSYRYSVSMNDKPSLNLEPARKAKQRQLETFYPSQSELFRDKKYGMFYALHPYEGAPPVSTRVSFPYKALPILTKSKLDRFEIVANPLRGYANPLVSVSHHHPTNGTIFDIEVTVASALNPSWIGTLLSRLLERFSCKTSSCKENYEQPVADLIWAKVVLSLDQLLSADDKGVDQLEVRVTSLTTGISYQYFLE